MITPIHSQTPPTRLPRKPDAAPVEAKPKTTGAELVLVAVPVEPPVTLAPRRTSAPYLAHLIATRDGAPQTRERRRAEPQEATETGHLPQIVCGGRDFICQPIEFSLRVRVNRREAGGPGHALNGPLVDGTPQWDDVPEGTIVPQRLRPAGQKCRGLCVGCVGNPLAGCHHRACGFYPGSYFVTDCRCGRLFILGHGPRLISLPRTED